VSAKVFPAFAREAGEGHGPRKEFFDQFEGLKVSFDKKSDVKDALTIYNFCLLLEMNGFDPRTRGKMLKKNAEIFARMKTTFFKAPFLKMIERAQGGDLEPYKFDLRQDEHVWAIPMGKLSLTGSQGQDHLLLHLQVRG
jgi:hypothetical protein